MPDFSDLAGLLQRHAVTAFSLLAALAGLVMLVRIQIVVAGLRRWVMGRGVIRRAELVFEHDHHDHMGTYVPKVRYEFEVNGQMVEGTRLSPTGDVSTSIKSDMEAKIAGLEVGDRVDVYYDPRDPRRSALTLQADGMMFATLMLVGGLAFALGSWMFGG